MSPEQAESGRIGRLVSSTLLTLIVIPAIYAVVKGARSDCRAWRHHCGKRESTEPRYDARHDEYDGWNGLDDG
jgi:hypothetical protein